MTEISEAAKAKANELMVAANGGEPIDWRKNCYADVALARFIQQVSDAANLACESECGHARGAFLRKHFSEFILPEPVDLPKFRAPTPYPGETTNSYMARLAAGFEQWANTHVRKIVEDKP